MFKYVKRLVFCTVFAALLVAAPAFANTGTTGETTWINNPGDAVTTNQTVADAHFGCPDILNVWASGLTSPPPVEGLGIYAITPTANNVLDYVSVYSSYVPVNNGAQLISVITVPILIASARDAGAVYTPGLGYHFELRFDTVFSSTVDFWVDCPPAAAAPTPTPDTVPTPTPNPPNSVPTTTTTVPAATQTTTTTTTQCPRFYRSRVLFALSLKKHKTQVVLWVNAKPNSGVKSVTVNIRVGRHVWRRHVNKRTFRLHLKAKDRKIWAKKSWKKAKFSLTVTRTCGDKINVPY